MRRLVVISGVLAFAAQLALAQVSIWKSDLGQSKVNFTIRHLAVTDVHGTLPNINAIIHYDQADITQSSVVVTIGVDTVNTGEDGRDDEIKSSDFFGVDNFPTATFISTNVSRRDAANGSGLWIRGNLTLHGVTKSVVLGAQGPTPPVHGADNRSHSSFIATATIDRTDFNIGNNYPNALIGDEVKLQINLQIIKE